MSIDQSPEIPEVPNHPRLLGVTESYTPPERYACDIVMSNPEITRLEIVDNIGRSTGISMTPRDKDGYVAMFDLIEDFDLRGVKVGEGILTFYPEGNGNVAPHMTGVPFVGETTTAPEHLRNGWGRRRLLMFNEIAKFKYGQTLSSDLNGRTEPEAASLWKKLAAQGLAEEAIVNGKTTWRFIR